MKALGIFDDWDLTREQWRDRQRRSMTTPDPQRDAAGRSNWTQPMAEAKRRVIQKRAAAEQELVHQETERRQFADLPGVHLRIQNESGKARFDHGLLSMEHEPFSWLHQGHRRLWHSELTLESTATGRQSAIMRRKPGKWIAMTLVDTIDGEEILSIQGDHIDQSSGTFIRLADQRVLEFPVYSTTTVLMRGLDSSSAMPVVQFHRTPGGTEIVIAPDEPVGLQILWVAHLAWPLLDRYFTISGGG